MSENLDLVRWILAAHERGDYSSAEWADRDIEYAIVGGPTPGNWKGRVAMAGAAGELFDAWKEHRTMAEEFRQLDSERVLVLVHVDARGKASGLALPESQSKIAVLYQIRDGRVIRHVVYLDRADAFADLDLEE
jgi:ketosteroid isomerase-like protein